MSDMILKSTSKADPHKKLLLVVEDDEQYRKMFCELFEKEGFQVEIAVNGTMALEIADRNVPQLVILDILMPIMDGYEFIKEFKENEKLKDVPIVVLSNLSSEESIQKAKDLGVADYIVKSNIAVNEVVELVKKHLK